MKSTKIKYPTLNQAKQIGELTKWAERQGFSKKTIKSIPNLVKKQ